MTYVWEVHQDVRQTYTGANPCTASCSGGGCTVPPTTEAACLPVEVDLGVLLGWTYYPNGLDQCNDNDTDYALNSNLDGQSTKGSYSWQPLVSSNSNPPGLDSLYFDVSCSAFVDHGTVPLGPSSSSQQNNDLGNPGALQNLPLQLNIPFSPTQ